MAARCGSAFKTAMAATAGNFRTASATSRIFRGDPGTKLARANILLEFGICDLVIASGFLHGPFNYRSVTPKCPRWGKLSQAVPDHRLADIHIHKLIPGMHLESKTHKFGRDLAGSGPCFNGCAFTS